VKRFFCLIFCFIVFTSAFSAITPPAQPVPVMPAPLPPAQNITKPATPISTIPVPSTPVPSTPVSSTPVSSTQVTPVPVITPVAAAVPVPAAKPIPSVTPVPVITPISAGAPVSTSPTLPVSAPVAASVPAVQSKPEASVAGVKASNDEKEFDELYQKLNQVAGIKKELKQQLGEIEEKLDSARKMAIESKETSFKIFQQSQTPEAEALVAQVEKNLQSLTEVQKKLNDVDLPKFEDSAKKIQEIMQVIQSKMTELEAKGLKFQISQAQLELQKQSSLAAKGVITENVGASQAPVAKPQTEKTLSRKIYEFTTSQIASGISTTKRAWQSFKKWVYSRPEESPTDVKKNSKPFDLTSEAAIKNLITEFDGILKKLDDIQILILQKYTNIKSKAKNLEIMLKSNDDIRRYFERLDDQSPAWKESAVNAFSSAIDGVYTMGKATKKTARIFYDKFLKGFVGDVKGKIHEQEKQPNKPIETQPKESVPATPEMKVPAVK